MSRRGRIPPDPFRVVQVLIVLSVLALAAYIIVVDITSR